jgi:hypothetical protein
VVDSLSCASLLPVSSGVDGQPLTRTEKLVLLAWGATLPHGDEPVSLEALATACLATPSAVAAALRRLENKGLLSLSSTGTVLHVRPGPALLEPGASPAPRPTPEALLDGLVGVGGILDGFRADYADEPVLAYHAALAAAEQLAKDFAGASKDLAGYLRNAVLAAAARDAHELEGKALGRLCREAKILGARGAHHVVAALFATASSDITGDTVAYVCRAARRLAGEEGSR